MPSSSASGMNMFRNLKLLLWKNLLLKKRKPLITVLEVLMPLLFSTVIMYLRFNSLPRKRPPSVYQPVDVSTLPLFFYHYPVKKKFQLLYIPSKSKTLKDITEMVQRSFDVDFEVRGCASEPAFESYIINDPAAFYVLTGMVFDHSFNASADALPLSVRYSLRFSSVTRNFLSSRIMVSQDYVAGWNTAFLYPLNPDDKPREYAFHDGGSPGYYREGFLGIQHALDKAIMQYHARDAGTQLLANVTVLLKRFPHGPYVQDTFFSVLQNEFPPLLVLSFVCIELTIINSIALEKERGLKGYMCVMGLRGWLHWVAWFITSFISVFIAVAFMTVLFCTKMPDVAVFNNSDPCLIFVFLLCFALATLAFAFMASMLFTRAHVATAAGGILFFFTYIPYLYITSSYTQRSHLQKIASCLFSNVAMALGIRFISLLEAKGVGLQWRNIGDLSGDLNFTQVLLLLLLDFVLYGVIAWYLECVFPGAGSPPRPWYFLVMPSYWRGEPTHLNYVMLQTDKPVLKSEFLQEEPADLVKGVEIQHLYKVFENGKNKNTVVKDLTMTLYRGQITVLLGHNGAGKTTTCAMLTGVLPISSGQIYVNGYDVTENTVAAQKGMGWCPQHNILFYDLTVAEHLCFFAWLKGLSRQKCQEEVRQMLRALGLEDKRDTLSKFLSGGMQRKLSIGIALVAGSEVLTLDEPTSGLDAVSRRAVWDLLQQQKSDRTILLTTHFMDEADVLGDRVAIMAKGELQCCGSPLFLKQKYGAGYYMTLVRKLHCNTEEVARLVYYHVPSAVLEASLGEEQTFILPKDSTQRFESMFADLEQRKEELGVSTFGATTTTMEEVFLRVNKLAESSADTQVSKFSLGSRVLVSGVPAPETKRLHSRVFSARTGLPIEKNTGFFLFCQQLYALLLKRMLYSWRHWTLMLSVQVLVPLAVVAFSLVLSNLQAVDVDNVPLELTLRMHGATVVPFFISPNASLGSGLSERFAEMLQAEFQTPLEVSGSVEEFLLRKAEEEPEGFDTRYVVAASIEKGVRGHTAVTALFNNEAYHSPALALTLVDNFLFKLLSGAQASITVTNHPQPQTPEEVSEDILYQGLRVHYLVINLLFGMAFLASSFSILPVKENFSKAKHLQFVSGAHVATFWFSALLWDLISFLVPSLLLLVVFLYYKEEPFTHEGSSLAVLLTLMLYGWATIPLVYITSFCFTSTGSAFVKLIATLSFLSIGPFIIVSVTSEKDLGYPAASQSLDDTFLVFPGHCLGMALTSLYYNYGFRKLCSAKSLSKTDCFEAADGYMVQEDIYAWQSLGIGKYLTALAVSGPVYLVLLFLIESHTLWRLRARVSGFFRKQNLEVLRSLVSVPEDPHVTEERRTVQADVRSLREKNPLVVKDVSKVYFKEVPLLAVDRVSLTVQAEECFGLLGINGAGKTSIFKMLTGEELITSGDAFVQGFSINSDLTKVWQHIGYCPQFDALLNHMTGQETLVMYSRLRGIPECYLHSYVAQMLDEFLLYTAAHQQVCTYSGGNKRKLSSVIALIGDPAVVLLDEPSTSMDPVARRLLWGSIARACESGKAVVFTSHSMEEYEALCTRLAVMAQGQFKCLGSPQHLKSKFGSGCSLRAKVRADGQKAVLEEFKAFVQQTFPGSILEDEHQGMVHYHLPGDDLSWAKVFGALEKAKEQFALDDYAISQVSLEDIFLKLASPALPRRGQTPEVEGREVGSL